ncbi:hypothetical protein GCM10023238_26640 [Streptomyces heliomycini]
MLTVLALRTRAHRARGPAGRRGLGGRRSAGRRHRGVQALVGRLRRTLGADQIASVDGGYRLTAAPDDIDLHRFERLAGDGLRALADGDPAKAAVVLDDALALWHGPALTGLPDRTADAARLRARHLDVLRARHTRRPRPRRGRAVPARADRAVRRPPPRRTLQALRLRALRDTGRTAEALAAYEDVRRLLADRLGSTPAPNCARCTPSC